MLPCKVAVLGLDAADFGFLRPWMERGELPTLARLCAEGASGPLRSTVPPVSSPAWATFMTGLDPGGHGLLDFVVEDPTTGHQVLARSDYIRGRRLWEVAADAGKRAAVVNVPITWPARPFAGRLVTGMLTPLGKPFTHPPGLGDEIRAALPDYRYEIDPATRGDREKLRAEIRRLADLHFGAMLHLLRGGPWDLFVGVFTTTDRAKHLFWPERETLVLEHYKQVDGLLARLLEEIGKDALVLTISDHGYRTNPVKFYMNRWLRERGLLEARKVTKETARKGVADEGLQADLEGRSNPTKVRPGLIARLLRMGGGGEPGGNERLEVDLARSRAYLFSAWTQGVKINLKGRPPGGVVEPGTEYEALRDSIIEGLRALRYPGTKEPLFDWVGRREEIYRGKRLEWAPDVVTRSDGYKVGPSGANLDRGSVLRVHRHDQGTHSDMGILSVHGPGARKGAALEGAGLEDVMPTVLWALGVPIPDDLAGKPLLAAFDADAAAANPVRTVPATEDAAAPSPQGEVTPEEEEELRKTLEGLGYV